LAPTLSELRIGWTLLALLTAAALLPASPGLVVGVVWLLALLPGSVVLAHPRAATRAAEALRGGLTGRMSWLRVALTAGLLTFAAMVYSVSAALLLATALLSAMLVAASRGGADRARAVLEHALPLAAALVLVLVPLEFVLRIPSVARQFGLPVERARQEESYPAPPPKGVRGVRFIPPLRSHVRAGPGMGRRGPPRLLLQ
jgi:hypothetical protein